MLKGLSKMPKFGKTSSERLSTCDVQLQQLMYAVIEEFDCSILCGHRTREEQTKALQKGFSKVDWPKSKHNSNPSKAVDVVPYPVDWADIERFKKLAEVVKRKAKELNIKVKWGGDFTSFKDYPHWELE